MAKMKPLSAEERKKIAEQREEQQKKKEEQQRQKEKILNEIKTDILYGVLENLHNGYKKTYSWNLTNVSKLMYDFANIDRSQDSGEIAITCSVIFKELGISAEIRMKAKQEKGEWIPANRDDNSVIIRLSDTTDLDSEKFIQHQKNTNTTIIGINSRGLTLLSSKNEDIAKKDTDYILRQTRVSDWNATKELFSYAIDESKITKSFDIIGEQIKNENPLYAELWYCIIKGYYEELIRKEELLANKSKEITPEAIKKATKNVDRKKISEKIGSLFSKTKGPRHG